MMNLQNKLYVFFPQFGLVLEGRKNEKEVGSAYFCNQLKDWKEGKRKDDVMK